MIKIILSGCRGRMGRAVARLCALSPELKIIAGLDLVAEAYADFPVYTDLAEFPARADVFIDFSVPHAIGTLLDYCVENCTPLVLCTTGHNAEQLSLVEAASEKIPILRSANMSLGVHLLADLCRRAAAVLGEGFDVELIERHHNQKVDAPSGTALLLADALREALPYKAELVYDRHERREARPSHEIGMHTLRGGGIVGDHEVIFAGSEEVIELKHSALTREAFALGAARAAVFLSKCEPGLYGMTDLIQSI